MKTKNGFCKHNILLINCPQCWTEYQKEENRKWLENLRLNAQAVRRFREVTYPQYVSICGDPIEPEQFH